MELDHHQKSLLLIDYIYLDLYERKKFAKENHFYLIEQIQTNGDYYFQNFFSLDKYYQAIDQGEFPIQRGLKSSKDDLIRRDLMFNYIINESIDTKHISDKWDINFDSYFSKELADLVVFFDDGLDSGLYSCQYLRAVSVEQT